MKLLCCMGVAAVWLSCAAQSREPLPYRIAAKMPDTAELLAPSALEVQGWLGVRVMANATNRLLTIDTAPLLAGFQKKPGIHPWIGEHVGKWMHAATLAWAYTGNEGLKAKLDATAAALIAAQEPDGYLGTYVPEKRFGLFEGADWDVWSHKYNLIGLLTYYQYTGNEAALAACRRIGDLLVNTFGPGRKSILSAGTHVGMAATSVLEPVVLLYRFTGEPKYLDFARYIVRSWDEPNGPGIIKTLLNEKQVNRTANGKAYEMLSNLVGLCELARATGDRALLTPVLNAWQDIVDKRLYLTGSASQGEHFRDDYQLPNQPGAAVSETCVTTTWIQLNLQLLRLTGEAKFGTELEKTVYNHLAAAQRPRGDDWCYFTPLEGKKSYDSGINCCHSSGPRGMALAPLAAYMQSRSAQGEALLVNTFETSSARVELDGAKVSVRETSGFPFRGNSKLEFVMSRPARFSVQIRTPTWGAPLVVKLNGRIVTAAQHNGWSTLPVRRWQNGERLELQFALAPELVIGKHSNTGLAALVFGPFVMAYDSLANPGLPAPQLIGFQDSTSARLKKTAGQLQVTALIRSARLAEPKPATFVPFADAGSEGGGYRVWLPAPGAELKASASVLEGGEESRSRAGNVNGSIIDGDASTFVVTFDNRKADEDWYAVALDKAVEIRRIVFVSGNVFHDGGWFDASAGKPRVQAQTERGGPWETLAELGDYPATTSTEPGTLRDPAKRAFTVRLEQPKKVVAIRIVGQPASGDNPNQAFSSCAEVEAFAE